ncbi:MAG: hypothetical protein ACO3N9_06470 [Alphaproteobacteria bacterium]
MKEYYSKGNLKTSFAGSRAQEWLVGDIDPLKDRIKFKFHEAETFRPTLKSLTAGRLAALLSIRELHDFPEIAPFRDPNPGQILWLTIMGDFYCDRPTDRTDVLRLMGNSYRTSEMLIREAISGGAIVSENDPVDRRRSILFPSIQTVCTYEAVLTPKYLEAVDGAMGDRAGLVSNRRDLLNEILGYYHLRNSICPESFVVKIAERQAKVNLTIVADPDELK